MGKNLIKNIKQGLILLIAISLSLPVSAKQQHESHHKSQHAVKHQSAHSKNVVHKKTAHKQEIKKAKVASQSSGEVYIVQPGDVFGKVAQKYQPPGMSLKQVMQAIYAKNKSAFIGRGQKTLIVGAKLAIPSSLVAKVEIEKVEAPVKSQAPVTSKVVDKTPSGIAHLEDDPKNKASQIKPVLPSTADQQSAPVVSAPSPATVATSAPVTETASPAPSGSPIVSAGEVPAAEEKPPAVRHATGINGFILVALIIIALFVIVYFRIRAKKLEKSQQELINELMRKRENENF